MVDIPIKLLDDKYNHTKSETTQDYRNSEYRPDKIIFSYKIPAGFWFNIIIFYFFKNFITYIFHNF